MPEYYQKSQICDLSQIFNSLSIKAAIGMT